MEQLHNKGLATLLCVVMVAASALLGARMSLSALRAEAEALFSDEGGGVGIAQDVEGIAVECHNLNVIAGQAGLDGDTAVTQMMQTRDRLQAASSTSDKYRLVQELAFEAEIVAGLLAAQDLDAETITRIETRMTNINACLATMSRSPYNGAAAAFNEARGKFPANILGTLTGVKPLELFA